ncbi:monomeric [FeFe] hydrogenase [Saccharicrinis sp. FJH54]|uniref:monomeric [FeFe] hydrogenase n=1 Tax=Saccharicrinis sp. FJH54 TaxID=3344665 RepID=UPI0035D433E6
MAHTSNTMIIRRELLSRIVRLHYEGVLEQEIDRIPLKMAPKNSAASRRCCIHKERAVIKYKSFPLLGFTTAQEEDELTPLSEYARQAYLREKPSEEILTVVDEACTSCIKAQYVVSNMCRGCVARPCVMNCPKDAVSMNKSGQAEIDTDKCINCGICQKECQYHAIIYQPIPCEAACPVGAISKNENKIEEIDHSKCIYCGKCLQACPFGSIFEVSQMIDILRDIDRDDALTALFAPSIHSQFSLTTGQIHNLFKILGFKDVVEVADGAVLTTEHEAKEFGEKMAEGQPLMTTSCCPGYMETVKKHIPQLMAFVSETPSPMAYAARIARENNKNCKTVFVGPCIAKRKEAADNPDVDYVLSFEELNSIIVALGIDLGEIPDDESKNNKRTVNRGFAMSGGVLAAVKSVNKDVEIRDMVINGLDKKSIAVLKAAAKGKAEGNFIEVMCCEGGCIAGPGALGEVRANKRLFETNLK